MQDFVDSREYDFSKLVIKEQLESLRNELKAEIATSQTNILKWMIPLFFTVIAMVATVMFKMFGH